MTTAEFTRKCRELQGRFRERMGEPMGKGPYPKGPNYQINMLVNGEKTGKNFVNEFTFNYAKYRVKIFSPMKRSIAIVFSIICCQVNLWPSICSVHLYRC